MQAEVAAGSFPDSAALWRQAVVRVCSCGTFAFAGCPGGVYRAVNVWRGCSGSSFGELHDISSRQMPHVVWCVPGLSRQTIQNKTGGFPPGISGAGSRLLFLFVVC